MPVYQGASKTVRKATTGWVHANPEAKPRDTQQQAREAKSKPGSAIAMSGVLKPYSTQCRIQLKC